MHRAAQAGPVHGLSGDHSGGTARGHAVHSPADGQPFDGAVPADACHVDIGWINRCGHDRACLIGVLHTPDLHVVGRDRLTVRAQPAGRAAVFNRDQPAACEPGHPRHQPHPGVVADLVARRADARVGVGVEHSQLALIPGLHGQQQALGVPVH